MLRERYHSEYGSRVHRKQVFHGILLVFAGIMLVAVLAALFVGWKNRLGNEKKELLRLWENGLYEAAYGLSGEKLEDSPMDSFLLTIRGFSAFQLAVAQINTFDTLRFIDDCIWALRKVLLAKHGSANPQVPYVLGKAYYHKGPAYADLAVQFLEKARAASYSARDIPEYLGLAYASLRDYRNSVISFSLALDSADGPPSDRLLLYMAQSYIQLEEMENAKAYLLRCIDISKDSAAILSARFLLGSVLSAQGQSAEAEALYLALLEENPENAEAHFRLGELYSDRGDAIRARAEWRRAYRIDPAHEQARARLNV
jgi:tetratricopeptide (TPR) repeat protein